MSLTWPFALLAISTLHSSADDWPGWRGPAGGGIAARPLSATIAAPENLQWKVPIPGRGVSSPIIVGDRVFLTSALPKGTPAVTHPHPDMRAASPVDLVVISLNRRDGSVLWQRTVASGTPHQAMHRHSTSATPTMTSDGEHLVVSFGSFGLFALTLDGEPQWEVDLGDLEILEEFGEGSSPALENGVVVQVFDHEGECFIAALDVETGEELWRSPRPRGTNWTTPLIVEVDGAFQVIVGAERVAAYDLDIGDEIWWLGEWPDSDFSQPRPRGSISVMSSPVAQGDLAIVHRGENLGLFAIDLTLADGDLAESDAIRWSRKRDLPEVSSPLLHGGMLYMIKANQGLLTALDASTGEPAYGPERLQGVANVYASPIASGDLLFVTGRDGEIEVLAAGATFESLAVHELDDGFDASPAVAGGQLIVRGSGHLYCFEE